jgi:hypothetical protein
MLPAQVEQKYLLIYLFLSLHNGRGGQVCRRGLVMAELCFYFCFSFAVIAFCCVAIAGN